MIRYKIIAGDLPQGCRIVSDRGQMRIDGVLRIDPSFQAPVFATDSNLGAVDEQEPVGIPLDITVADGRTLAGCTIIRGAMPFGLYIDGQTISGEAAESMTRSAFSFLPENAPKWTTRDGALASAGEFENYSVALATETPATFYLVSGNLPWGLTLLPNGEIKGKTTESAGEPVAKGLAPLWNTARGHIAFCDEFQDVSLSLSATPRTGTAVYMTIINGTLPFGLQMSAAGMITGKISEQGGVINENTALKIVPTLASASFTGKVGQAFSATLQPTIPQGRTLGEIKVVTGYLPFGLTLTNGVLSGTPTTQGVYSFDVVVLDSIHATSTNTTITIEVTA